MQSALARPRQLVASYAGDDGSGSSASACRRARRGRRDAALERRRREAPRGAERQACGKVDGVVVVRTAAPQQRRDGALPDRPLRRARRRERPGGRRRELGRVDDGRRRLRAAGLSTVDDVDKPTGRLALALLLDGGPGGRYGIREADDALMPPIEPLREWLTVRPRRRARRGGARSARRSRRCASSSPGAEILVADDGSRDATAARAEAAGARVAAACRGAARARR